MNDMAAAAEPEVVTGTREQLLHLLAEASEIEHTLMCSYLYAAFSLKSREEDGLTAEQVEAAVRWRRTIIGIAIEEMGHLLMVANLTVAVGGAPHFARPNFPVSPGYFPSDVVVRLTGFSEDTLDHFIFLERPRGIGGEDSEAFEQEEYAREQAHDGLMPSAQDYRTIGHLYEALRTNLLHLTDRLGEEALFIGGATAQLGRNVADLEGVDTITGIEAALRAIDVIVEQGEGSPRDRDDSHYRRFVEIRQELAALHAADPEFTPAWPVADNPVLRRPPEPEDKVFIDAREAAVLLDFACAAYGLLLRLLVQSFGREPTDALARQKRLFAAAIELMHVLGAASEALARVPASADAPGVNAGMSFTMLRGVEPLLSRSEEVLLTEQLGELARHARAVPALPQEAAARLAKLAAGFRVG
ncbi:ferritin-like domain-containing protein [Sphingomonas sp.]|uniref:ferritin-like domain-containing protein n=1 Tax=Sphingomonas sp. TaxID=28214 RepID=UPI002FC779C3